MDVDIVPAECIIPMQGINSWHGCNIKGKHGPVKCSIIRQH